jgi:hypothetical protein
MVLMALVLRRFWIKTSDPADPSRLGYGVTAYDEGDARDILSFVAFQGVTPQVAEIRADVDVRDLDRGRILPNMNPPNSRGIWYPQGLDKGPLTTLT